MAAQRICHVIFEHSVFDGRVFFKEAASTARAGYDVVLLVPHVRRGWLGRKREQRLDGNTPFVREGVRFETYPYRKWLPRQLGLRHAVCRRDIVAALRRIGPDLCHFHEDGLTMEVAADLKKHLPAVRLVFDYHESFVHRLRTSTAKRRLLARFVAVENRVLDAADGLVTVSDFISQYYRTLFDGPVVTVMNCQSSRVLARPAGGGGALGPFRVVHEGRMLFDRGLKLLVAAAAAVREASVQFLLIGSLPPAESAWFESETRRLGIRERFQITGMLPYEQVAGWLARGSLGVYFMQSRNGLTGVSNKFFNYLCFGLPVLTLDHPLAGPMVRDADCGTVFPAGTPAQAVAERIDTLYRTPELRQRQSRNAQRLFETDLNWECMEQRLLQLYQEILGRHGR